MVHYLETKSVLEKISCPWIDEDEIRKTHMKIATLNKNIEHLKPKLK